MFRTALRNVFAHKARLLMTLLAVLLGVAFVAGTMVFTSTVSAAYQKSSQKGFRNGDLAIDAPLQSAEDAAEHGERGLTEATLARARALPGAESATGSVTGFTALADKEGKLIGENLETTGGNYDAGPDGRREDPRYPMKQGRAPRSSGEAAIDSATAERTGFEVGDTARLSVDGPVLKQRITGVFDTDDGNVAAGGTLVLFDTDTAQRLFAEPGRYDQITLKAADGTSQRELKEQAKEIVPSGSQALTGRQLAEDQAAAIEKQMSGMQTGMLVFAGISLFVGVFIIANTFTMLVAQRTRELALLRAVGAGRRQVTRSVLIEALVVGALAAVAGLAAGVGIGAALRALMGSLGAPVPEGPLVVDGTTVGVSLATGVVVTVLAAWLPGRRAAKIPPVAAMSSVHAVAPTRSLVVRNVVGALLAAAGSALVVYGTGLDDRDMAKFPLGAGAATLVVGMFVLTPLLSRPLIAAAAPLTRVFGVSGKLARQNSVRNPRRTAATASALMIGLTLITGLTVVAGSVQHSIEKMATESLDADYTVSMAAHMPLSADVERKLARDDQVEAVSPLRNSTAEISNSDASWVTGVNGATIGELTDLPFVSGGFDGFSGRKAVIDKETADAENLKTGSTFPLTLDDGTRMRMTVSGVYEGNDMIRGVLVDTGTLDPHLKKRERASMQVLVKTRDGVSDSAQASLEKALGNNPAVLVQDEEEVSKSIAETFTLMLNMLYGLLAMAVIVAVLGVVNTLAMSVFERSQEIGMLRAVGLERRGIKRMVRLESLIISLFGGVLGIGLGVFFGWAAGEVVARSMPTYELVLPWDRLGIFLGLAALVGMLAALWPARRAAKLNMLTAITTE